MLANPQFLEKIKDSLDNEPKAKDEIINSYGGCVAKLSPATYRISRDPYAYTIVVHQDRYSLDKKELSNDASEQLGNVFVDTRCLAMIDRELLDDIDLLDKYKNLWMSGKDKLCRDLIRDNGGAVRYGFQRFGDELGVYAVPDQDIIALWPDVAEDQASAELEEEQKEASLAG